MWIGQPAVDMFEVAATNCGGKNMNDLLFEMVLDFGAGDALPRDTAVVPAIEGGSEAILVVEDDNLVRTYVVTQLQSLGYDVTTAANAGEALAVIDTGKHFDVLFTDVIMPGMNGRQLADKVKELRPSIGVLYTSGYSENAIVHHGRLDPGVLLLANAGLLDGRRVVWWRAAAMVPLIARQPPPRKIGR